MKSPCQVWAKGGEGALDLANKVLAKLNEESKFKFLYDLDLPIKKK